MPHVLALVRHVRARAGGDAHRSRRDHDLGAVRANELHRRHLSAVVEHGLGGGQVLDVPDPFLEALLHLLVVQAVRRRVGQRLPVHQRDPAPLGEKRLHARLAPFPLRQRPLLLELARVGELDGQELPLLVVEHLSHVRRAHLVHERVEARLRLLDLHHVVREQLGRRVDRRETAADDDGREQDREVRDGALLVGTGELQSHQEVARLADAAREVVLDVDDRRLARAGGDRDVVEAERPRVLERDRPAEADAAVDAEVLVPREAEVRDREEVLVPARRDSVFAHAAEAEEDALVELAVERAEVAHRRGGLAVSPGEAIVERLDLEPVHRHDPEPLARQVVRQRVPRRAETDDEHVLPVVGQRVRAAHVERVPAREEAVDLHAPGERERFREHPRLDLRDVDRLLLLEDARLHAVVADAVAGAGAHRVVEAHEGERAEHVAVATHDVHLADLLFQRAPLQRHADRVLLEHAGRGLRVAHPLGARVLVALVAVEAVVDLLLDGPGGHTAIGEGEGVALAAVLGQPDEELGELVGLGAPEMDEVVPVERLRLVERLPAARGIARGGVALGEPGLDRVEGEGDGLGCGRRRSPRRPGTTSRRARSSSRGSRARLAPRRPARGARPSTALRPLWPPSARPRRPGRWRPRRARPRAPRRSRGRDSPSATAARRATRATSSPRVHRARPRPPRATPSPRPRVGRASSRSRA